MRYLSLISLPVFFCSFASYAQEENTPGSPAVIAYYAGRVNQADSFAIEKITHIIFSFCHLKGDELYANNAVDTARIERLVSLKYRNRNLKVMVSLGGWGGCASCSEIFSSGSGRKHFSRSVKKMLEYFHADGIDLDWEYPAVKNYPGHAFKPEDKRNFTLLVKKLRKILGPAYEISFAAGGFSTYLENAVEWNKVMPLVNRVNLMSYDLVSGYDTVTGHHTPLYAQPGHKESVDYAVHFLDSLGVPKNKIAIGAAFYARIWEKVDSSRAGLFHGGHFLRSVSYNRFQAELSSDSGFMYHWDALSQAPYLYHPQKRWFVTFDDSSSVAGKTRYVIDRHLNGIMFWQLSEDKYQNGLLDVIDTVKRRWLDQQGKQ